MKHHPHSTHGHGDTLRVATYNIHKGVRGVGPRKRLEIHNLGLGIEALDADLVFLQEVRSFHHREARRFERTSFGWPREHSLNASKHSSGVDHLTSGSPSLSVSCIRLA